VSEAALESSLGEEAGHFRETDKNPRVFGF
jgi:hypothetical protein